MTPPLLADDALEFLLGHPELFFFALVIIAGLIKAAGRAARSMVDPDAARKRDPVLDADPESLLPPMLRTRLYEEEPEKPARETQRPAVRLAPEPPAPARRARRKERKAPMRIRREQLVPAGDGNGGDDHQSVLTGPLVQGEVGSTYTTHDGDIPVARRLLGSRRPTQDDVRRAILWGEILGPPRALKPWRAPSRRGGGAPSSIAIVPLRDRPKR